METGRSTYSRLLKEAHVVEDTLDGLGGQRDEVCFGGHLQLGEVQTLFVSVVDVPHKEFLELESLCE